MKLGRMVSFGVLVFTLVGCDRTPSEETAPPPEPEAAVWSAAEREAALTVGAEALTRLGCNRCHRIDDVPMSELVTADDLDAPDLSGIATRLKLDWVGRWIMAPHDLRPMLEEAMVRTRIAEKDLESIIRYFAAIADAPLPEAEAAGAPRAATASVEDIAEGRTLFLSRGCVSCHTFGNIATGVDVAALEAAGDAARFAPNLRFTRERMTPEAAIAVISDPSCREPNSLMPDLGLSDEEASRVVDFLFAADPELLPKAGLPNLHPPAPVDRPVSWEEVKARVFGRVCTECHRNDHERDPGPGNEGAYGWPGEDLSMRTYESLVAGVGAGEGQRFSVLEPRPGADNPFIINMMIIRRIEALRDHIPPFGDYTLPAPEEGEPGMPMGMPPVSDEDMAMVLAWIQQGCVGPSEVSGTAGILDGPEVPDGPLAINRGCELRAPATSRPPWAAH